jgi:hypothetical protein
MMIDGFLYRQEEGWRGVNEISDAEILSPYPMDKDLAAALVWT